MPKAIPFTSPSTVTLAVSGALLLHIPPPASSLNNIVDVKQTTDGPVITPAAGNGIIVTIVVVIQPAGSV